MADWLGLLFLIKKYFKLLIDNKWLSCFGALPKQGSHSFLYVTVVCMLYRRQNGHLSERIEKVILYYLAKYYILLGHFLYITWGSIIIYVCFFKKIILTLTDFTLHFSCCFTKILHSQLNPLLNNFTMQEKCY